MTKNHNNFYPKSISWNLRIVDFLFLVLITFLSVHDVFGAVMRKVDNDLEVIEFQSPELYLSQSHQPLDNVLPVEMWERFLAMSPEGFVFIDPRSGRPTTLTHIFPLPPRNR